MDSFNVITLAFRDCGRRLPGAGNAAILAPENGGVSIVRMSARRLVLGVLVLVLLVAVGAFAPKAQDQSYHLFADTEPLGPIPNGANVLSNSAFLGVGLWGLATALSPGRRTGFHEAWERWPWALFFAAIALTAFGSGYYHWKPDDTTLFWDRLPMTVAFTSLVTAVLADRVDPQAARRLFLPFVAAGLAAILAWRFLGDLRPYIALQATAILVVLVSTIFFRSRYLHGGWMAGLLAGYAAALLFEVFDREVRSLLVVTGGHPLKHLAAAAGTACVVMMLKRRQSHTSA
jgi:hypothetical protein